MLRSRPMRSDDPVVNIASSTPLYAQQPAALPAQPQPAPQQLQPQAAPQPVQPQQPVAPPVQQPPQYAATYVSQQPVQASPPQMVAVEQGATTEELRQSCPGAPADFILQMIDQQATVEQAMAAYIGYQNSLLQAAPQATQAPAVQYVPEYAPQQAVSPQQPVQIGNPAVAMVPDQTFAGGNPADAWDQAVSDKIQLLAAAGVPADQLQSQAVLQVDRENPGLRQQAFVVPDYSGFRR